MLAPQPDPVQAPGDEFPASDDPKHRGEQELAVCANWLAKVLAVDGDDDALGAAAGVNFIK